MDKQFISAQSFLESSLVLSNKIIKSGFKPNFIIALWRGGTFPGCVVQEVMKCFGIENDHIAIRTSGRDENNKVKDKIEVYGLNYIARKITKSDKLLIVDDVYDSGLSIKAVIDKLKEKTKENFPEDIRIATVYYKPLNNKTNKNPDYYVHITNNWLVLPHEFMGLNKEELLSKGPEGKYFVENFNESN